MIVGFTGTRQGMTDEQLVKFGLILPDAMMVFKHGAAIGADEQAAACVRGKSPKTHITAYPSNIGSQTSEEAIAISDTVLPPDQPLKRNRDIIEMSDVLIAAPAGMTEELRSGTWATVRLARRIRQRIIFVWPDGTSITENNRD
jgi:hypothetical protein